MNAVFQKVLVTGGAGFIGSHTVDLLLKQGKEVVVLDNLSSGRTENLNMRHPGLTLIEGDVLEYPLLEKLMADCDAVLHLAAVLSVQASIENPVYSFQVNTQGSLHVFQAASCLQEVVRVVYASSAAVYGDEIELPCEDTRPLSVLPLSPYALQKKHAEEYAALYAQLHHVQSLGLRYFNVFGSRQDPHSPYSGVISRFLDAYQHDRDLTVFGDGQQSRDFIHVSDVAKANCLALENGFTGVLNIAGGEPHTLLQVIACLEAAGKKPARKVMRPARLGDIRASYATIRMAEKHIGFKASLSLQEGLSRMLKENNE